MMNDPVRMTTRPEAKADVRQEIQLACFRVGMGLYAIDILRIKEIIRPLKLTPLPKAPEFVEGVINLRGAVIPIIDLRKRFDLVPEAQDRRTRIIICTVFTKIIGLVVDEVAEVRRYTRQDMQPAPQFVKGKDAEFFLGVCRRDDELIMVLDLERILSNAERISIARSEETQKAD